MSSYKNLNQSYFIENYKCDTFTLKKVSDPEDLKKGLMFIKSLPNCDGMLFDFGRMKHNSLWMKNTYIPLDAVFLDNNYKIVGFVKDMKPHSLYSNKIDKESRYIVEINSGEIDSNNLQIGDKLEFKTI